MDRDTEHTRRRPSGAAVMRTDLTTALFKALFEEWAEFGYAAISLERVALRAGAGKAAIYRRWAAKPEFASQALQTVGVTLADFDDHGSLREDLTAYLLVTRRVLRHRLVRRILLDLQAERMRSGDLSDMLDRLSSERRRLGKQLLDRAVERGELSADMNKELALDWIPGPLYKRMMVRNKRVSLSDIQQQVAALVVTLQAL
jgi:AcrR family transcriptional regulator